MDRVTINDCTLYCIERQYFDVACERITKAYNEPEFDMALPTEMKQEAWHL